MNNTNKLLAVAVVFAFAFAAVPTASAQSGTGFGTQVVNGDVDFRPTAQGAQTQIGLLDTATQVFAIIDFGITNDVNDNCVYARIPAATAGNVANFNVRLTPCQGKAAGTFVGDADTVEKSTTVATFAATTDSAVRYADVNNNGRYDAADCVYAVVQTDAGAATAPATLIASTGNNDFTVRLTPCQGKAAGTFVFAGDADFTSYGGAGGSTLVASATSGLAFFDADNTGSMTSGDSVYFVPTAIAAGGLFPQFAVRAVGGAGDFGSQVKLGDSDFIPVSAGADVAPVGQAFAAAAGQVFSVDFGITGQVTDDCLYYRHAAVATAAPINFDVRLTPCQGKAAGTLVGDADTVEKSSTGLRSPAATSVKYADVNNNGRYDAGDYVYIGTTAVGTLAASTASNDGAGAGTWTVRLTPAGSFAAGTYVFAGDADFVSYANAAPTTPAGSGFAFFDADNTGSLTTGDALYYARGNIAAAGAVFPHHSLRIVGGSGAFGSQLALGDADFLPTLISTAAVTSVAGQNQIDFGIANQVTDNCFYYQGAAGAIVNFNVRLTPCQGKGIGTLVGDSDTVEKSSGNVGVNANAAGFNYADVNNNGRYDAGDYVYIGTAAAPTLTPSTANNAWTLRLTPAGSFGAGTLVFAGDADQTSYGNALKVLGAGTGVIAYFDADNTATITTGDVVYVLPGALPAGGLVPQFAVRISGEPTASGSGQGGVGTGTSTATSTSTATQTSTGTGTSTTTVTQTQTSTQTATSTGSDTGTTDAGTPGFELVALVAALGAALVLVRRRL